MPALKVIKNKLPQAFIEKIKIDKAIDDCVLSEVVDLAELSELRKMQTDARFACQRWMGKKE